MNLADDNQEHDHQHRHRPDENRQDGSQRREEPQATGYRPITMAASTTPEILLVAPVADALALTVPK